MGTGAGFPPLDPVFPSFHQCSGLIFFYVCTSYSFQKNKREKAVNLQKSIVVSEICHYWVEKYFHLVLDGLTVCSSVGVPLIYQTTAQTHLSIPLKISQ
jgi:hypothetical protein